MVSAGDTVALPFNGSLPPQPSEAEHELAFVLDHVSVEDCPALIDAGFAEMDTVGVGAAVTVTVTLLLAVPPLPVQERV